jgi:hypothetical protein
MRTALIKLSYRQIIDSTSPGSFEQNVLTASFNEFLIRSKAYDAEMKYKSYSEMLAGDESAQTLQYKCGAHIVPHIELLNGNIPQIRDMDGRYIKFQTHKYRLIESGTRDRASHKISITYVTDYLTMLDSNDEYMILVYGNKKKELAVACGEPITGAFTVQIVPGLSICSFEIISEDSVVRY